MSQRNTYAGPCAEVREDAVLAAAYDVLLDLGPRRATLTEVARRAGISRMTVYRRHAELRALISDVLTAELATVMAEASARAQGPDDRTRIAITVTDAAQAVAEHPLMARLIDVDPETLLPLLVSRRGSTQRAAEMLLTRMLEASADGSVRAADPAVTSRTIVTAAMAFIFSEALARAEGDDGRRWVEFARLVEGYL